MIKILLEDSILKIKNIGQERAKKLNKLNIYTINDLITYFPRDYEDRTKVIYIKDIIKNEYNIIKGKIISKITTTKIKNISISKTRICDKTGFLEIVWFNQPYLKNTIKENETYIFKGKVIEKYGRLQLESPEYEIVSENDNLSFERIIPIYSSTYKFSQKMFRDIINKVLNDVLHQVDEFIPQNILKEYSLCDRQYAIKNIHFPENNNAFFLARKRLVFEELFLLQLRLLQIKDNLKNKNSDIEIKDFNTSLIEEKFNFELTKAQKDVIKEIKQDLKIKKVMNRLIQGDVGSGKTAIAQIISYLLVKNGYQVAIMAPTDVLASQHFNTFSTFFNELGHKIVFLSGNLKAKEKKEAYNLIQNGQANIVVGTHALIQEQVVFNNLGVVITDEQHRFGVKQREALTNKGKMPHTIIMTATPIPRTLALILYGDLDISIINEMPPNRQEINTSFVNETYYPRIYNFLKKNADEKKQAYIICPMIEENEKLELKAVLNYTEKLKEEIFKNYKIECIHGKMKNCEKQEIMDSFNSGQIDILVSTTVIEVGINVPNATIIVIENAERFGISQLHQLRGRVGRGSEKSYCILVSNTKNKSSKERLNTMVKYSDGFKLSEKDLELRGFGDFFGTRQHGLPEMKIANLYKDIEILKLVQKASIKILSEDKYLSNFENKKIKQKVESIFMLYENNIPL